MKQKKKACLSHLGKPQRYVSSAHLQTWVSIGIVVTVTAVCALSDLPGTELKKKRDALHLMRTSPRELDWSPMILNGNDRCVMGDNNSVELRWGTPAKMLQLRPGANALASCWLGILLHPVTHWLNRSYSAMFEGRVPGMRTSIHPWSSGILQRRERSAIVLCFQQTAWHGIFPGRYPPLGALGRKRKEK